MLSTFNITVQLSSPRWVSGRTLAIYQMVVFGGMAIGSWIWGEIAENISLVAALATSCAVLTLSVLLGFLHACLQAESLNLGAARGDLNVTPKVEVGPESGRVITTVTYQVAPRDHAAFVEAMQEVRRIRRRDGARRWMLMQDMSEPELWIERFHSPSWVEHVRRYHRFTVADQEIERARRRVPSRPRTAEDSASARTPARATCPTRYTEPQTLGERRGRQRPESAE